MSIEKIAILLEIMGVGFEGIVAAIFGERKIQDFLQHIASSCSSIEEKLRNKLLPATTEESKQFVIGIFVITSLDCIVIFGWLQSIAWLFWAGIGGVCLVVSLVFKNKESRDKQIPQWLPRWLFPLYILLIFIPIAFTGAPILLILSILGLTVFKTMSFILNFLTSRKYIRWVFLGLGIAMILAGLSLECRAIP